jgi:ABC-type methionine transport system ATPase subunit
MTSSRHAKAGHILDSLMKIQNELGNTVIMITA